MRHTLLYLPASSICISPPFLFFSFLFLPPEFQTHFPLLYIWSVWLPPIHKDSQCLQRSCLLTPISTPFFVKLEIIHFLRLPGEKGHRENDGVLGGLMWWSALIWLIHEVFPFIIEKLELSYMWHLHKRQFISRSRYEIGSGEEVRRSVQNWGRKYETSNFLVIFK